VSALLLNPVKVWSRQDIWCSPCPVPRESGIYAWYFRGTPSLVPLDGCVLYGDLTLLYVGIAPKAPPATGGQASGQTLWHRIRYHYRGNAAASTLRLTLGCLLAHQIGIQLRRVGSGKRMTFGEGEDVLSAWMAENSFVCWHVTAEPWLLEKKLIGDISLPLNLDMNKNHPFRTTLSRVRREAKVTARNLPTLAGRTSQSH
jgi:hypothetical protein